ncbi:MAG: hypothetical protein K9G30_01575, partial [Parvibaculum sp.]|nr:hypothetical protein [Parvibaculum sp.]
MSNFMKTAIAVIVLAVVAVVAYQWFNPEDTTVGDAMEQAGEPASDAMDATRDAAEDAATAIEDAADDMSGDEAAPAEDVPAEA